MAGTSAQEATVDLPLPERTPIPSGDHTVWADVSPLLDAACKDLQDGMLIHGDNFNLFAAMSALEIMDPKMDSGMICKYYSVDEAIENGAAPVPISFDKTIDVQCTIDIMDHLLACEGGARGTNFGHHLRHQLSNRGGVRQYNGSHALLESWCPKLVPLAFSMFLTLKFAVEATWHKGHSLAQTVFSCIYLLRPDRTSSHPLLHSYCRVIRATCKTVISVVSDARTHEEEDLFIMTYGLPLNGDGDEKCLSMLNAVEETISRQLRACKAPSSKNRVLEDLVPLQNNIEFEEGYCKALLCRLRFRKHFYHVLTSMRRPQGRGLELARKHIASCISELKCILNSSEFLRSSTLVTHEGSIEDKTTASGRQPIGFDASLNCRLSAPTPPRAIKILSWKKAVEYFMKLLQDLDVICSYPLDPSLESVLHFVVEFQKSQPDLVARAHLQRLLVQDGKLYGRDPVFAVITRAAALPDNTRNHDIQKKESIVQLGQLVINLLKILCTNGAWQRRKLGKILQDWRVVYVQLEMAFRKEFGEKANISNDENVGVKLFQHILLWVEEQTYWIAFRFLILGFELELYSESEYCMVYWYIYVVLIKLAEKTNLKTVVSNGSGKRRGKKKRDSVKDVARDYQIPPSVLFLQCQICLAEGLTMMLAALRNDCMMAQNPSPFNTEHERFIQHFELLQKACIPDHVSFPLFMESTTHARLSNLVMYDYFKDAQRITKEVRSSFSNDPEKLAELRRLEQVAEHNSIALNVISRAGALDPSLKVSFEFNHHPCFATAVVKRC